MSDKTVILYTCKICKRDNLDPDIEDVHLIPRENGGPGHDAYCARCWSQWSMFCGKYGLDIIKSNEGEEG